MHFATRDNPGFPRRRHSGTNPSMTRWLLILTLLLPMPGLADDDASPEQLRDLRERIQRLQQALSRDLQSRDQLQAELRRTETRIGELAREGRELVSRQQETQRELGQLRERQALLASEQSIQIDWLTRTVRASYMSGREPLIKLLLNQQQPDQVARLLRYQEYFQRARHERVGEIRQDLEELLEVSLEVEATRRELEQRRSAVSAQQQRLKSARTERQQALERLTARLGEREQELESLREDEARLEQLLRDMDRALSDIPANPAGEPFGQLAGQLPWPVPGDIKVRFGSRREGDLRWNGVLLEAEAGSPVRAIHAGRVVFSDWLRGYGLMTIVDHGNRYLSLYGHNQSLLRDVGDWVATGDTVALAGDSGGQERSGIYFELRHDGKPVNPDRWCNRRVTLPPLAGH